MTNDQDILDAYTTEAAKDETHPRKLPPVRIIKIDTHKFVMCEIESHARAFYLTLAEASPGYGGKWEIVLKTPAQITAQVRAFVEEHQAA
jgi:hypothetical protein